MGFIKNIWSALWQPSKLSLGTILIGGFVAGGVFFLTFHFVMQATNSMDVCLSCHTMDWPYQEYKETAHYSNPSGVRATCSDCHVPHDKNIFGWLDKIWFKVTVGGKDLFYTMTGKIETKEKYEKHRWELANNVWKSMKERDSKECRYCHSFDAMKLDAQDRSAAKKHTRAIEEGATCIDCHKGIAHEEPEEPEAPEAAKKEE